MEQATISRSFKFVTILLFMVMFSHFMIFTFKMPWADLFADPTLDLNYTES